MRLNTLAALVILLAAGVSVHAQLRGAARAPARPARDARQQALYDWANHMGMLRGVNEVDAIATLELKGTGTIDVNGQPCTTTDYHVSVNYQQGGQRVTFTGKKSDGSACKGAELVRDKWAWDEDGPIGAGLVPGRGTAKPMPAALNERLVRLWSSPQGAVKAAVKGGDATRIAMEGGKMTVTFPVPGTTGITAKATLTNGAANGLCTSYCAERVDVQGATPMEFLYSNYADYNPKENQLDAFYAGHIVERRGGMVVRDLTVKETQTANLYVVIPVPASISNAAPRQAAAQ